MQKVAKELLGMISWPKVQERLAQGTPLALLSSTTPLQQQLSELPVLHKLLLAREARLLRSLQQVGVIMSIWGD